ncbi:MAG: hypothetical protein E7174_03695 [Firmicutes bacterium]|nr:hypothetical protein [Bacillota bacterium]
MNDFSLVEKIKLLVNIIVSSPLFLFCFMIGIAVLILFIICVKKEKKVNKWIFIAIWTILGIVLVINYNSIVLELIDKLFDALFMALYFPNITVYFIILFISNLFFIYSLIGRRINKKHKIINFINALIINLFLILIIDIVKSNSINIYNELSIYTNSNLLVLMQLNSSIFTSWILISLLVSAHEKLKKYDEKELPEMPEIVFEDV